MPTRSPEEIFQSVFPHYARGLPRFPDGRINYTGAPQIPTVSCFPYHRGAVGLLLRATENYRDHFGSLSGYLDKVAYRKFITRRLVPYSLLHHVQAEAHEELGMSSGLVNTGTVRFGEPFVAEDPATGRHWHAFPALLILDEIPPLKLNEENFEITWVSPSDLQRMRCVPHLGESLERALATQQPL